eukprot:TRINITY_DN746_c0_g1_i2.p1 TRINITY_DN746_c0_g1~~TRINITY_DN746_c0_g1_i2.p1  ORF type:complete len:312 (+),score=76.89 TRINITY_DN746_c0_g1_i2:33-938(+)
MDEQEKRRTQAEARRQKILANSQSRLKRITNNEPLSTLQTSNVDETTQVNNTPSSNTTSIIKNEQNISNSTTSSTTSSTTTSATPSTTPSTTTNNLNVDPFLNPEFNLQSFIDFNSTQNIDFNKVLNDFLSQQKQFENVINNNFTTNRTSSENIQNIQTRQFQQSQQSQQTQQIQKTNNFLNQFNLFGSFVFFFLGLVCALISQSEYNYLFEIYSLFQVYFIINLLFITAQYILSKFYKEKQTINSLVNLFPSVNRFITIFSILSTSFNHLILFLFSFILIISLIYHFNLQNYIQLPNNSK